MNKVLLIITLVLASVSANSNITASIDKNQVILGDQIQLTVDVDHEQNYIPDLKMINKDFKVLATEQRQQYNNINGKITQSTQWIFIIEPRNIGTLKIPPIKIGNSFTKELKITVNSTQPANASEDEPSSTHAVAFMKLKVFPKESYVNQAINLKIKFFTRYELLDASYSPPEILDGLLVPIGQLQKHREFVGGERYAVQELDYKIFPQKSGQFVIKAPKLQALLASPIPKRVTIKHNDLMINIKPAQLSAEYPAQDWVPTEELKLYERFNDNLKNIKVGDVITRIINMRAINFPAQLLPELSNNKLSNDTLRITVEKVKENTSQNHGVLIGMVEYKISYQFLATGDVILPGVTIPWFNVNANIWQQASLPKHKINVTANKIFTQDKSNQLDKTAFQQKPIQKPTSYRKFYTLLLVLVNCIFLGIAVWFLWQYYRNDIFRWYKMYYLSKQLHKACKINDALATSELLLEFANLKWPKPKFRGLNDLAARVKSEHLAELIQELQDVKYNKHPDQFKWNGIEFWRAWKRQHKLVH